MPCARREIERGHSGRCPRKGGKGGEGASSPEGGGGTGNPVRKGTRDAALPGRDSRPRRGPRALRGDWEGDRAGGTPRSAVWDPGEREAAGPSTGESRAEGSVAGSSGDVGLLLPRRRRAEGGRGQGSPRARRCPRGPEKVPCAGALSPDEVGAVAAEGGLLEEAGGEFVVLHLVHVLLPEGAFAGEAHGALLSLARRRPRGRVSHLARGEPEPEKCRLGAAGPRAAGPGGAEGGGRLRRQGPRALPLRRLWRPRRAELELSLAQLPLLVQLRLAPLAPAAGEGGGAPGRPRLPHLHRLQAPPSAASCFTY